MPPDDRRERENAKSGWELRKREGTRKREIRAEHEGLTRTAGLPFTSDSRFRPLSRFRSSLSIPERR
jgi:hypothetical protein